MTTKATGSVSFPKLSKIIFGKWLFVIVLLLKEIKKHRNINQILFNVFDH